MTPEALRRIALSLPETHEAPHFERTSFRVGKRIFATIAPGGREAMVKLPSADLAQDLIEAEPDTFFGFGTWTTRNGALGVRLGRVRAVAMRRLVIEAWRSIAPRRAVAAFERGAGRNDRGRAS